MKAPILLVCVLAAAAAPAFAADKVTILDLRRDVELLTQQVKDLQRSQDEKFAAVTELARQAIEAANRANTGVAVIQSAIDKSLKDQQQSVVAPVVGLSTRLNDMSSRVDTLTQAVTDLTTLLNRMQAQLTDINNQVKTMQAPPPPAPTNPGGSMSGTTSPATTGGGASDAPCMPAETLYRNASGDYQGGKFELALSEYGDYLRCYGATEFAPNAQFYIAYIHYSQHKFEQAANEFDLVLEKYTDNPKTPEALFYKGKALVQIPGRKTEGGKEFQELIKRFPTNDRAKMACDELKGIGLNCPAPSSGVRKASGKKK
jgi:TolA-binding protein